MLSLFWHWLWERPDIIQEIASTIKSIEDIFIEFTNSIIKRMALNLGTINFDKMQFCSIVASLKRSTKKIMKRIDNPFETEFSLENIFYNDMDDGGSNKYFKIIQYINYI